MDDDGHKLWETEGKTGMPEDNIRGLGIAEENPLVYPQP